MRWPSPIRGAVFITDFCGSPPPHLPHQGEGGARTELTVPSSPSPSWGGWPPKGVGWGASSAQGEQSPLWGGPGGGGAIGANLSLLSPRRIQRVQSLPSSGIRRRCSDQWPGDVGRGRRCLPQVRVWPAGASDPSPRIRDCSKNRQPRDGFRLIFLLTTRRKPSRGPTVYR